MFREHFERLNPVCPVCRVSRRVESSLAIGSVAKEEGGEIIEGSLICSDRACQREHPILDGIPIVLADAASWVSNQSQSILRREDLGEFAESMIGDLAGPGTAFDYERGNLSIYADAHWAPESPSYLGLFSAAMNLLSAPPNGVWIDVGCSVGRGSYELASRTGDLVVGLDLNFSMLRMAQRIRRSQRVTYGARRVGVVFDQVSYPARDLPLNQVSFWCADVAILPFRDGTFSGSLSMNMLDCVGSPLGLLYELSRVAARGTEAILCTPFDWGIGATALSGWIGGHSQRCTPEAGSSLSALRLMFNVESGYGLKLAIEAEVDGLQWRLRTNERSVSEYSVYMARLRRDF